MTGANCEVLIDGRKIKYIKELNLNVQAGGMAVLTLTMYGSINMSSELYQIGELSSIDIEPKATKTLSKKNAVRHFKWSTEK